MSGHFDPYGSARRQYERRRNRVWLAVGVFYLLVCLIVAWMALS